MSTHVRSSMYNLERQIPFHQSFGFYSNLMFLVTDYEKIGIIKSFYNVLMMEIFEIVSIASVLSKNLQNIPSVVL